MLAHVRISAEGERGIMGAKSLPEELQSAVTVVSGIVSSEIPPRLTPAGSANLPEAPPVARTALREAKRLTCDWRGEDVGARTKRAQTGRDQPQLPAVSDLSDISRMTRFRPRAAGGRRWERIMTFVFLTSQVLGVIISDKYVCVRVCGAGSFPRVPGYGGFRFIKPGSESFSPKLSGSGGLFAQALRDGVARAAHGLPISWDPHSFGAEVLPLRSVRG